MIQEEYLKCITAVWPKLSFNQANEQMLNVCTIDAGELVHVGRWLFEQLAASLVDAFALVDPASPEDYLVRYVFDVPHEPKLVVLQARVAGVQAAYPGVSMDLHAADWYEREIYEMYGLNPLGHPALGNFVLRQQVGSNPFPLRKDFGAAEGYLPQKTNCYRSHPVEGNGVFEMPLGPVYSGVAESAHFVLTSIGEETFWVTPRLFYKHRGLEKSGESLPLERIILLSERISGIGAVSESLAFCQAVESAAGLEIPPRALYLRSILAELERLYNHIGNLAELCESTSLAVGEAHGFMLRERLQRLNALLTGHRYLMGSLCPGGVRCELDQEKINLLREVLKPLADDFRRWIKMLLRTDSFLDRLENIGVLNVEAARNMSATGPVGRASGQNRDWRRDRPYAAYDRVRLEVPVENDGDCFARMKIRVAEVEQSLILLEQLLAELPGGALVNPVRLKLSPGDSAIGYCEGPRGVTMHWVLAGESERLWRYRIRTPSLVNWHTYPVATENCAFQDFPIILASFGLSFAESDR